MTINQFIEIDPRRCNGKPTVAGTRIPVTVVIDQLAEAGSIQALLSRYPELTHDKVVGVLSYLGESTPCQFSRRLDDNAPVRTSHSPSFNSYVSNTTRPHF